MYIETFILVINYKPGDQAKYKHSFFLKTGILNTAAILMKATKNLVIIASRFWTRYLIEQIYMLTFPLTLPPLPCLLMFVFSSTPFPLQP